MVDVQQVLWASRDGGGTGEGAREAGMALFNIQTPVDTIVINCNNMGKTEF